MHTVCRASGLPLGLPFRCRREVQRRPGLLLRAVVVFGVEPVQPEQRMPGNPEASAKSDCWQLATLGGLVGGRATYAEKLSRFRNCQKGRSIVQRHDTAAFLGRLPCPAATNSSSSAP
jgi:hypothetical protein